MELRGKLTKGRDAALAWNRDRRGDLDALPVVLNLPITDNCNARCVMCDVWKTPSHGEMGERDLRRVLSDRLFAQIRHVGISGGEPSLRADLPQLVEAILGSLPQLRSLSITTHGFHHNRWQKLLPPILSACRTADVALTLNLSVDGIGPMHDKVRGIPGAFDRTMRTLDVARALGITVVWQSTISSVNVFSAPSVVHEARRRGVPVIFRQATDIARLDNAVSMQQVALDAGERSFLADFLSSPAAAQAAGSPGRRLFYADLARRLVDGSERRAPCNFQRQGVVLGAHGELFQCSIASEPLGNALDQSAYELFFSEHGSRMRSRLIAEHCPGCVHDQTGAWNPLKLAGEIVGRTRTGTTIALAGRATRLVGRGAVAYTRALVTGRSRRLPPYPSEARSAVIVGAYGGEHVGDAAILGGVLLRLHRSLKLTRAHVASTRPDRTRRWVSSLDLPVAVDVLPYAIRELQDALAGADLLVHAGGPLMDLPELLIRHMRAADSAVRAGRPFALEGIGYGPFVHRASRVAADAIVRSASRVTVRSDAAARRMRDLGCAAQVTRDPAFDYLETRDALTRLLPVEAAAIAELLDGPADGVRIALNLRPFWKKYGTGTAARTREREAEFLYWMAGELRDATRQSERPLTFVFFPMNADQYGFSDLDVAYRLLDILDPAVTLRVWAAEPGVDAVLALLRGVDAAVTMRFHASIFALSQRVPTIGIDYQFGGTGKVGELFNAHDGGEALSVTRLTAGALTTRLLDLTRMRVALQR